MKDGDSEVSARAMSYPSSIQREVKCNQAAPGSFTAARSLLSPLALLTDGVTWEDPDGLAPSGLSRDQGQPEEALSAACAGLCSQYPANLPEKTAHVTIP